MICYRWTRTCYDQPICKYEVSKSIYYKYIKGDKNVKMGWFGAVRGHSGGAVAQRVDRWICDQQVMGSNPILEAKLRNNLGQAVHT